MPGSGGLSRALVVEDDLLFTRNRNAVLCSRCEGPGLQGGENSFIDRISKPLHERCGSDMALRVDQDFNDDVAVSAMGQG